MSKVISGMGQRELILTVVGVIACTYLASTGTANEVIMSIAGMTGAYSVSRGLAKHEERK